MLFLTLASLGLAALVRAQDQPVQVQVGGTASSPAFLFSPNNLNATNGTVFTFTFTGAPGNHSVTQSSFASPCEPLAGGFDSGWVSIPAGGVTPPPTWNLTVTDTSKPIWFYCKQLLPSAHCAVGMIGAINAPTSGSNTFDNYANNAKQSSNSGQGIGALVGQGASASAIPGPLANGATLFGTPASGSATATGASSGSGSGSSSSSSSTSTTSSSAANMIHANSLVALFAALMGITLA
ncbi:hypothetical protein D9757_008728 [Collybiopsis confluens]|uniref:Extracellular serine-rich protein n=1 Tax=Collybiopsis confluens TaxID=2823264 RepID=A0A8H5H9G4_9AGAR|nr:hypothetical protein D9757_008728 [Collybiopsis confluens]